MPFASQTAHQTRYIQADHLELVLFTRRLYKLNGKSCPDWAALSNGHDSLGHGCPRRPHDAHMQRVLKHPPMFLTTNKLSPKLVERVRTRYGLPEVKATWGCGYKAMLKALITPQRSEGV